MRKLMATRRSFSTSTGHGSSTGAAQLRFANSQAGDKTLSQNITISNLHANATAAIRTSQGSFGNNNFDLNLDGNITVETVDAQVDSPNILVLDHTRATNSSVRIGGATFETNFAARQFDRFVNITRIKVSTATDSRFRADFALGS